MEQRKVIIKRVRRKQHSSCDQCRKAKRACDAAIRAEYPEIGVQQHQSSPPQYHTGKYYSPPLNCSNCQKNGRKCTFEWLQRSAYRSTKGDVDLSRSFTESLGELPTRKAGHFSRHTTPAWSSPQRHNVRLPQPDPDALLSNVRPLDTSDTFHDMRDNAMALEEMYSHLGVPSFDDFSNSSYQELPWNPAALDLSAYDSQDTANTMLEEQEESYEPSIRTSTLADSHLEQPHPQIMPSLELPLDFLPQTDDMVSSLSFEQALKDRSDSFSPFLLSSDSISSAANRLSLSQNWLRVYHDSLENALSCWLTERNCPYSTAIQHRRFSRSKFSKAASVAGEWGPEWSNRIYARVCRLDQVSSSLPGKRLTASQQRQASKALNLAIMAFGVQWAQAGARGRLQPQSSRAGCHFNLEDEQQFPSADDFGRSMQELLWNQARQALHEAAGLQSYKIVFANIILSLTQRPLDVAEWFRGDNKPRHRCVTVTCCKPSNGLAHGYPEDKSSREQNLNLGWQTLQEILNADGPPIFLEAALRELVSSRWKWEEQSRQHLKAKLDQTERFPTIILSHEHQETFRLLSWLAIMFDTISATVLQRPPVVSDEDSAVAASDPWVTGQTASDSDSNDTESDRSTCNIDLDGWQPSPGHLLKPPGESTSDVWGTLFLQGNDSQTTLSLIEGTWPCTFDEAAAILCDAAPVKVLLFRTVGHIQKLMSRKVGSEVLEGALESALRVYKFWNKSYSRFMEQCTRNHHDLPSRIQSWYIVLAGHWHLGALLLADIIDEMDRAGLSSLRRRENRRNCTLSQDIRMRNAISISELCRCSLDGPALSFANAREFNYPVNQVALLAEPWTVVLIQSFSRAGYVFLSQVLAPQPRSNTRLSVEDERILAKRRCGYCIDGLINLGNKSDMAFLAGRYLRESLGGAFS